MEVAQVLMELPSSLFPPDQALILLLHQVEAARRCSSAPGCPVYELQRTPHKKTAQSESDGWSELATGQENFIWRAPAVRAAEDITLLSS